MDEDSEHIKEFRTILYNFRKPLVLKVTLTGQNTEILKTQVEDKLTQLYVLLKPIVFDYKSVETLPLEELQKVFKKTLGEYKRTPIYQTNLEYYLVNDLISLNIFDLNSKINDDTKYLPTQVMPHIINNNNNLTLEEQYDSE
jgi:hypothetical protein